MDGSFSPSPFRLVEDGIVLNPKEFEETVETEANGDDWMELLMEPEEVDEIPADMEGG